MIFLSDYDMLLTEHLVQGVDVWINTPRRPWEACGTSGMKVLVNGGINLSELDGWWAEAYTPEVGWALGDGQEHGDDPAWDAVEAEALYDLLEREVIPEFYTRDEKGIPTAWVARMRESMARLTPHFSANRTVREYTEQHYLPAAAAYRERAADKGAVGRQIVNWRHTLEQKWAALRFGDVKVETNADQHVFEVEVFLDDLDPNAVRVELYADGINGGDPVRQEMKRVGQPAGASSRCIYQRNGTGCPSGDRLYGASDTAALRRGGSVGNRSNPVATMMKTPKRRVCTIISRRSPSALTFGRAFLCLWEPAKWAGGVNFAIFSRNASRVRLELFDHPEDATPARVIDLDPSAQPHRRRMARLGGGDRSRSALCLPRGWPVRTPAKDIVSISTSFFSIPSPPRFRDCPRGILARRVDTIRLRPSEDMAALEARTMPESMPKCVFMQRAFRLGWGPAAPASMVEDRHL